MKKKEPDPLEEVKFIKDDESRFEKPKDTDESQRRIKELVRDFIKEAFRDKQDNK